MMKPASPVLFYILASLVAIFVVARIVSLRVERTVVKKGTIACIDGKEYYSGESKIHLKSTNVSILKVTGDIDMHLGFKWGSRHVDIVAADYKSEYHLLKGYEYCRRGYYTNERLEKHLVSVISDDIWDRLKDIRPSYPIPPDKVDIFVHPSDAHGNIAMMYNRYVKLSFKKCKNSRRCKKK